VNLIYFVVLVSALIFIHELGHFVVAKSFNVKVLTFSIGFGPRILRIRGKETEYCLALLPFGGFVKMLEESSNEPILPEDAHRTFEAQSLLRRALIVVAGPLMNIVFPVLLYACVFYSEAKFRAPVVGFVEPGRPADGKLAPGDVILAIDNQPVENFEEVTEMIAGKPDKPIHIELERDGKKQLQWVTPARETRRLGPAELALHETQGKIGISPGFRAPVIGVPRTDSSAYRAGLRTFDRIVSVSGRRIERYVDLVQILSSSRGDGLVVTALRPVRVPGAVGTLAELTLVEPVVVQLAALPRDGDTRLDDMRAREADVEARVGIESSELYVSSVVPGSSEWQAGLRREDRLLSVDGQQLRSWRQFESGLLDQPELPKSISFRRNGDIQSGRVQIRKETWAEDGSEPSSRYVLRITHWAPDSPAEYVPHNRLFVWVIKNSFVQTAEVIRFIVVGVLRMVQGRMSLTHVSGLVRLYEIAGEAGARGPSEFVWAMAVISSNLGLLNLLPIPVLDGGMLTMIALEAISKRRLSLRVRRAASLIGLTILMSFMVLAVRNDMAPRWADIKASVHDLWKK
jgi:regulator of sigma E protease